MINRRGLITGLISFMAAPAIVRAGSLMPVKMIGERYSAIEIINKMQDTLMAQINIETTFQRELKIGDLITFTAGEYKIVGIAAKDYYDDIQ
jgi:hypothetical protein